MMDISTQHYGIYCDNLEQSLDFYTQTLQFEKLFTADADENGTPLKMSWIRHPSGIVIELLQKEDYPARPAAEECSNHLALRVKDMDKTVSALKNAGVTLEVEPFSADMPFDKPLEPKDEAVFTVASDVGTKLKVAFFRGPSGERFELMQDNIGGL